MLAEGDLRALFDANGLVLQREDIVHEPRDLDAYLDLAGCEGFDRERAHSLAPPGYEGVLGWFVLGALIEQPLVDVGDRPVADLLVDRVRGRVGEVREEKAVPAPARRAATR